MPFKRSGQQPSVPAPLASARLDLVQRNVEGKEGKGEAFEVGRIEASQHVLPQVVADPGAVRQIVLNLFSNPLKLLGAGGQVIISTTLMDHGELVLRVRDTGLGMSEKEIAAALEPFSQLATSTRFGSGGADLALPLARALAQANGARFRIDSKPAGTLVEISFPSTCVWTE